MPTKWDEVILPFERVLPVPGLQAVYVKRAFIEVSPLASEEIVLQTPDRQEVIVRRVEIEPVNVVTMQFGTVTYQVGRSPYKPSEYIFRLPPVATAPAHPLVGALPSVGVLQVENVNMDFIKGGSTFGWKFCNTSPLLTISYWMVAEIFTRRQAN